MNIREKLKLGSTIILDGATGTELTRLGVPSDPTFGGVANIKNSEIVQKIHENYILSGCDIITTNTFGTCRHVLNSLGLGQKTFEINSKAVEIAKISKSKIHSDKDIFIAGSMTNYFALNENEYIQNPQFIPSIEEEEKNYLEMANILLENGVDFIILEMIADIKHAELLLKSAISTNLPVWVGISCCINKFDNTVIGRNFSAEKNPSLISKEKLVSEPPKLLPEDEIIPLEKIIESLKGIGGDVYGIMHSWIEDADRGLEVLKTKWNGPIMMYPEIGEFNTITHETKTKVSPKEFPEICKNWINKGVQIVGGCCGVNNSHIKKLVSSFDENK